MPSKTFLQGKTAVITGGSKGIGKAIALRFALEGARILITSRSEKNIDQTVQELCERKEGCLGFVADVSSESDVKSLVEYAYKELGAVDILVNNAGVYPVTPFFNLNVSEWQTVTRTNLDGPFLCSKFFAERMVNQRTWGRIINISSTASQIARPGVAHYASSKAGLNMLTKVLAVELAPHGITVNTICPGVIETETLFEQMKDPQSVAEHQTKLKRIPLGRLGKPEEIAAMALFLTSEEAGYITGASIFVDGGYTLGISSYTTEATT